MQQQHKLHWDVFDILKRLMYVCTLSEIRLNIWYFSKCKVDLSRRVSSDNWLNKCIRIPTEQKKEYINICSGINRD